MMSLSGVTASAVLFIAGYSVGEAPPTASPALPPQGPGITAPARLDAGAQKIDPLIAEAGACYWRGLGASGQDALEKYVAKFGFENALKLVDPPATCDPNKRQHLMESFWVVRGRMMWEISLKALSADHMDERYLRKYLDGDRKNALVSGAQSLVVRRSNQLDLGDFGASWTSPDMSQHQQEVAMYKRYYYVGRAIEQAAVEQLSGKNPDLL